MFLWILVEIDGQWFNLLFKKQYVCFNPKKINFIFENDNKSIRKTGLG